MKRRALSAALALLMCLQCVSFAQASDFRSLTLTGDDFTITFSQAKTERKTVMVQEFGSGGESIGDYEPWQVTLITLAPGSRISIDNNSYTAEYIGKNQLPGDGGAIKGKDRFQYFWTGSVDPTLSSGPVDWSATDMYPLWISGAYYFLVMESALTTGRFDDVPEDSPFVSAITWAVERGITVGTSATMFSPENPCRQKHILTFLWRSQGEPEYYYDTPFETSYDDFGKASRWAYHKGMIGASYNGDLPCTRAQAVKYLWILAGKPSASGATFPDVPVNASYANAIAWAVSRQITNGFPDGNFRPDSVCNRGQIAAFLYRAYA